MFRANIKGMSEAADEMQRQIRKLNQEICETESVMDGLRGLSGMDGVRRRLRSEIEKMEAQRYKLLKLMTTLQQAARCYGMCEQNNINYAEDSRQRAKQSFGWFQIPIDTGILNTIRQIVY